jgi:hypothetical protein
MSKLSETQTAEALLVMGEKGILHAPIKMLNLAWWVAYEGESNQREMAPDSQESADEATYRADLFQRVTEMLRDQNVTTERLREIAGAAPTIVEPEFVMEHDPT